MDGGPCRYGHTELSYRKTGKRKGRVECKVCKRAGTRAWEKRRVSYFREWRRLYLKYWKKANPEKYAAQVLRRKERLLARLKAESPY